MIKTQMEMYLHEELETLTRTEIEALQFERLLRTVRRCMKSPFYQKRFAEAHLSPEDIRSLDDLRKIPFTTKQDLRDNYPFGLAAVPMSEVVRLHSSSGTTGTPTVILHTQKDLDEWANAVARCLYMVGLRRGDVFQNSSGYGMFTGGLGFQYGAERLGMLTVPAAAGNTKRQIKFITDFGTTALHAIPSYASRIHEVMEEMGIDPVRDTKLRTLVIGAEPHSEEQRRKIEKMLGVKAYNSFGMSEMWAGGGLRVYGTERDAHLGRLLYRGDCGSADVGTRARRRGGRTGADHHQPRSYAVVALPYPRFDPYFAGRLSVRTSPQAARPHEGTERRHDDSERGQHLPHSD